MSLFKIDLSTNFLIDNSMVFFTKNKFKEYYEWNCLHDTYKDDVDDYIEKKYLLVIDSKDFISKQGCMGEDKNDFQDILNYVGEKYNFSENIKNTENKIKLYPEWLLFYIAINKIDALFGYKQDFEKYLDLFRYISEIRHKEYIIRDIKKFILNGSLEENNKRKILYDEFLKFLKKTRYEVDILFEFLHFLYHRLYLGLKKQEKYKLMWNLEQYIKETINLLVNEKISEEDIYQRIGGGTFSELHNIYKYKPLYIKESKKFIFDSFNMKIIKNIFKDTNHEDIVNKVLLNEQYEDIFLFYMEIINNLNAYKINEIVIAGMIKALVLGIEEIIRSYLKTLSFSSNQFNKCLEKLLKDKNLFNDIRKQIKDEKFLINIENVINEKYEDSLEKYCAIYYGARNYIAHNNIAMNSFFWGENGRQLIVSNVVNSVMIILYRIEMMKNENNF